MKVLAAALIFLLPIAALPKKAHVPLPEKLASAKTVMLSGDPKTIDNALQELTKWGRFQVVADKADADLVFEFAYTMQHDNRLMAYHESLFVHDAKTGEVLYQDARMQEPSGVFTVIPSRSMAKQMVKELRKRMEEKQ